MHKTRECVRFHRVPFAYLLLFFVGRISPRDFQFGWWSHAILIVIVIFGFFLLLGYQCFEDGFDLTKGVFPVLQKGTSLSADKASILVANDKTRTTQLTVSYGKVRSGGNVSVHTVLEPKHFVKGQRDLFGFDADAQELCIGNRLGPMFHLCRTRAAPASSTVVKMDDGRFVTAFEL